MHDDALATYPPLNTLKRVADNVWIADGPVIRFGIPWPKYPFPTRMTAIRLGSGDLVIHSPTPLTLLLKAEIEGSSSASPTPRACSRSRSPRRPAQRSR